MKLFAYMNMPFDHVCMFGEWIDLSLVFDFCVTVCQSNWILL